MDPGRESWARRPGRRRPSREVESLRAAILFRYVFLQLFGPFGLTVLVLSAIFLMTRLLSITDYVVNYHVGLGSVLALLLFTLPYLFTFVVPMAAMLAVLLTVLRMSSDSEITALKAGGMSLWQLLAPVMAFCLLSAAGTWFMAVFGVPWGRTAGTELVISVARQSIEVGLTERTFNDTFKDVVLYVNELDEKSGTLKHVFIEDRRRPDAVLAVSARMGRLLSDPARGVWQLHLADGMANQVNLSGSAVYSVRFGAYNLRLDLARALAGRAPGAEKDEEEMSLSELAAYVALREKRDDRYYLALMQLHKKFSMPVACLVLGLAAVPLGLAGHRARRSLGVGLGVLVFLLYYLILAAGEVFGEAGVYPPFLGMWMGNLVVGGLGLFLYHRAASDRPVTLPEFVPRLGRRLRSLVLRGGRA